MTIALGQSPPKGSGIFHALAGILVRASTGITLCDWGASAAWKRLDRSACVVTWRKIRRGGYSLQGPGILAFLMLLSSTSFPQSLQERIAWARAGDTLLVRSGTWNENIVLDRRITLLGEHTPVIRGTGRGSTITITADSCTISGFTIERCGTMLVQEDAGVLVLSRCNRILGNTLRDILFGVYLLRGGSNVLADNVIIGRKYLDPGQRGSGIHIYDSPRNTLLRNTITDVRDGIYIQNANHTHIEGNHVFDVRYGLHYMYADSNTFLHNRFDNNTAGAAIMFTRGIVMRHNVFSRNRSFSAFGVLLQDCHGLRADSNVIVDNVVGLFLENSRDNVFRHNVIAQNDLALQMFQNAEGNTFTENAFIDNLSPLVIVGKRTGTHWSAHGKGNYWSAYEGSDHDNDGVGDVPMHIQNVFQYLEGRNSAVRLFLYSPASQALATAAAAFPIMRVTEEADAFPLMRPIDMHALPAAAVAGGGTEGAPTPHAAMAVLGGPLALLAAWWMFRGRAKRPT